MADLPPGVRLRPPNLREGFALLWRRATFKATAGPACPKCGYLTYGLTRPACPECGEDLARSGVVDPSARNPAALLLLCVCLLAWTALAGWLYEPVERHLRRTVFPYEHRSSFVFSAHPSSRLYHVVLTGSGRARFAGKRRAVAFHAEFLRVSLEPGASPSEPRQDGPTLVVSTEDGTCFVDSARSAQPADPNVSRPAALDLPSIERLCETSGVDVPSGELRALHKDILVLVRFVMATSASSIGAPLQHLRAKGVESRGGGRSITPLWFKVTWRLTWALGLIAAVVVGLRSRRRRRGAATAAAYLPGRE